MLYLHCTLTIKAFLLGLGHEGQKITKVIDGKALLVREISSFVRFSRISFMLWPSYIGPLIYLRLFTFHRNENALTARFLQFPCSLFPVTSVQMILLRCSFLLFFDSHVIGGHDL